MAIQRIEEATKSRVDVVKEMCEMSRGEVCYVLKKGHYVVTVSHPGFPPIFLILDSHNEANSYQHNCSLKVRELYPGESVTIEFF